MDHLDELSRRELLALKEVQLTSRMIDSATALKLIHEFLIVGSPMGYLKLTAKGRRTLVRGSPTLWDSAS